MNTPSNKSAKTEKIGPKSLLLLFAYGVIAGGFVGPVYGAETNQPTQKTEAEKKSEEDDVLVLSPFTVTDEKDVGYQATSTLAGTRLRTNLGDIAASVDVMTPEFLKDIGATNISEADLFSVNTESVREFSDSRAFEDMFDGVTNFTKTGRSRGIASPVRGVDFFETEHPIDFYNIESLAYSYGPNAILFGLGDPSGYTNAVSKRAKMKNVYEISSLFDSEGGWRITTDLNQQIIPKKLALRLAYLNEDRENWRKPTFDKNRRLFVTGTFQLDPTTTFRASYETISRHVQPPREGVMREAVTPYLKYVAGGGAALFNNVLGYTPPAANDPAFKQSEIQDHVLAFNSASPVPIMLWRNLSVQTKGPNDFRSSPENAARQAIRDESLFPFDININGEGTQSRMHGDIVNAVVEKQLFNSLFVELAYNKSRYYQNSIDYAGFGGSANNDFGTVPLSVDANKYLPNGVTPNPNAGRFYFEAMPNAFTQNATREHYRATAAYELKLDKRSKWLGNHRIAGLYQKEEVRSWGDLLRPQVINNPRYLSAAAQEQNGQSSWYRSRERRVFWRFYIDDPRKPGGKPYINNLPFDPFTEDYIYNDPNNGDKIIFSSFNSHYAMANARNSLRKADSYMGAVQSDWLDHRIALTYGVRKDDVWYKNNNQTQFPSGAYELVRDKGAFDTSNGQTFPTTNRSLGIVVRPLPWLRLFYNQSSSLNQDQIQLKPTGESVPGQRGEGKDYGAGFTLMENRLDLRISHFSSNREFGPAADRFQSIRGPMLFLERVITGYITDQTTQYFDPVWQAKYGKGPNDIPQIMRAPEPIGTFDSFNLQNYSAASDLKSDGWEATLVANPTRNWTLRLTGAINHAVEYNIMNEWVQYAAIRLPTWQKYFATTYIDRNGNTSPVLSLIGLPMQFVYEKLMIPSFDEYAAFDGNKVNQGRDKRVNFSTAYHFSENAFKGMRVGGSVRWRSKNAVGFGLKDIPNGFGGTKPVFDGSKPVYGTDLLDVDGMIGYSRPILRGKVTWDVQLNIRNLLGKDSIIPQLANSDGTVTSFTLPEPRTFLLSNTFSF